MILSYTKIDEISPIKNILYICIVRDFILKFPKIVRTELALNQTKSSQEEITDIIVQTEDGGRTIVLICPTRMPTIPSYKPA